jgi:anti-sigma regulatory factor (Ser/Thr protein kinase)
MPTQTTKAPKATAFERAYPGTADQLSRVRADLAEIASDCPAIDGLLLLASELAANAILHSRSGCLGHSFTVRAVLYSGDYAWVEIVDEGGTWAAGARDDEHGRGLGIVATVAGDGNWGIDGDAACRVAWFRLEWDN